MGSLLREQCLGRRPTWQPPPVLHLPHRQVWAPSAQRRRGCCLRRAARATEQGAARSGLKVRWRLSPGPAVDMDEPPLGTGTPWDPSAGPPSEA
eukprot:scaffold1183_cov418-Prasinococcus_capsulatus_cf.AAC.18